MVGWNASNIKRFFNRVLTPGFAYNFSKNRLPIKYLINKKAIVF